MVGEDRESTVRIGSHQPGQTPAVGSDDWVSDEHIPSATGCDHLRFGNGGALVFVDTGFQFQTNDLTCFVRLDVRPQPSCTASHLDGADNVVADQLLVKEQGRAEDLLCITDKIVGKHGSALISLGFGAVILVTGDDAPFSSSRCWCPFFSPPLCGRELGILLSPPLVGEGWAFFSLPPCGRRLGLLLSPPLWEKVGPSSLSPLVGEGWAFFSLPPCGLTGVGFVASPYS